MGYFEEHLLLMREWKQQHKKLGYEHFIEDGIIEYDLWQRAPRKVLFLLKEAYGEFDSLVELIKSWEKPKYNIWWNVAYWAYCAQYVSKDFLPEFPYGNDEACALSLKSSVIVNVKKSDGNSASDYDDLSNWAEQDKQYLSKQIQIIDPDVIICGYTINSLQIIWDTTIKPDYRVFGWIYRFNKRLIADFYHPSNKYPAEMKFYTLGAMLQKAYGLQNI